MTDPGLGSSQYRRDLALPERTSGSRGWPDYSSAAAGQYPLGEAGCPLSPAGGFTGGGLVAANVAAVDGDGHVFVSNFHGNSISELNVADGTALSAANGYRHPAISLPQGIAIDASGNLWLANFGNSLLIKFIGIAAPVQTPLIGLPTAP